MARLPGQSRFRVGVLIVGDFALCGCRWTQPANGPAIDHRAANLRMGCGCDIASSYGRPLDIGAHAEVRGARSNKWAMGVNKSGFLVA